MTWDVCRIEAAGFSLQNFQIFMNRTQITTTNVDIGAKMKVFLSEVLYVIHGYNWNTVCHIYILFENLIFSYIHTCTYGVVDTHRKVVTLSVSLLLTE